MVRVEAELGSIEVLVNNAGWDIFKPFADSTPEEWQRLIDINLIGPMRITHAGLGGMVERGLPGAICLFASDDAAFITGQVSSVSGGLTMVG